MVCSLHSVTTGSRDRANVSFIIIIICDPVFRKKEKIELSCWDSGSFICGTLAVDTDYSATLQVGKKCNALSAPGGRNSGLHHTKAVENGLHIIFGYSRAGREMIRACATVSIYQRRL